MQFDFETMVERGPENLKRSFTPECIRKRGIASFAGAEMDFPTAPSLVREVVRRAENGLFGYTLGDSPYREHIRNWMEKERGCRIEEEWIVPSLGTIYSVASLIRLVTDPGDAIITMTPVYYRYEQAAARQGRRTLHCPLKEEGTGYTIDFENLEWLMAEAGSKILVLCNPHNPVGRVYTGEELRRIADLSRKYGVYVISDEIFAEIVFDKRRAVPYIEIEEGRPFAVTVTSLGKAFNLTGVNHANLLIPDEELRERMKKQRDADHFGSIDPMFYGALEGAYSGEGAAWLKALLRHLDGNRRKLMELARDPKSPFTVYPVEGTFVAWLKWTGVPLSGKALQEFLIKELYLDLEPGEEYGEGYGKYTRMNLAATGEQFAWAMNRIREYFRM